MTYFAIYASSHSQPIVHVPPRVDQDYYQAEVSDDMGDLPYGPGGTVTDDFIILHQL